MPPFESASANEFQSMGSPAKRRRGRPRSLNPKLAVSLRLEPCVVEKFRATGPGWQRRMNEVLRDAIL
jgi:uncharacterized protein (DUF4415 family)